MASQEKELQELKKEVLKEYEEWQIKLREIVSAMQKKSGAIKEVVKDMRLQKEDGGVLKNDIRILFIILGGAMEGSYGAGQMLALQEMGYTSLDFLNEKDTFLGISVGAAICAFGMTAAKRQALLGTSYFYTICTDNGFIKYNRMKRIVDVSIIEKALRDTPTRLDVEAIYKNPAQFYVQAYNIKEKVPEFINAKASGVDLIDAIHASMAIPLVYNQEIIIEQSKYSDGGFDDPLPLSRAINKFKPSHVLILPNVTFNQLPAHDPSKIKQKFIDLVPKEGSLGFIRKLLEGRQTLRHTLDKIAEHHNVKIGVAWPPEIGIQPLTQDKIKIKTAIKEAARDIFTLFGEKEHVIKLYEEEYLGE